MSEKVLSENSNVKKLFSDAIHCTLDLLHKNNYLTEGTDVISRQAAILGQEIFAHLENIRKNLSSEGNNMNLCPEIISRKRPGNDNKSTTNSLSTPTKKICVIVSSVIDKKCNDDESKKINKKECKNNESDLEGKKENKYEKKDCETVTEINGNNFDMKKNSKTGHETIKELKKKRQRNMYRIPLELKKKIVMFAKKNPGTTLMELERRFGCSLSTKQQLRRWEKEVNQGGTVLDRRALVYSWVYQKVCENKKNNINVTTAMLQAWALEANNKYFSPQKNPLFAFSATRGWVQRFKSWCKKAESSANLDREDSSLNSGKKKK